MHRALNIAETCQLYGDRSVCNCRWIGIRQRITEVILKKYRDAWRRHARASPFLFPYVGTLLSTGHRETFPNEVSLPSDD